MRSFFKMDIDKFDCFIFDLDNTIYDERKYLFYAYKRISDYLEKKYLLNSNVIYDFLEYEFLKNDRFNLLDKCCKSFIIPNHEIEFMLHLMRSVTIEPKIETFPYFLPFLSELIGSSKKVAIVTNGNVEQQKNKIECINWQNKIHDIEVVFANNFKPKPDASSYFELKKKIKFKNAIYIGDSNIDKLFAINSGIEFENVNNLNIF